MLNLAAKQGEAKVDDAMRVLLERGEFHDAESVERLLGSEREVSAPTEVEIAGVDLQELRLVFFHRRRPVGN